MGKQIAAISITKEGLIIIECPHHLGTVKKGGQPMLGVERVCDECSGPIAKWVGERLSTDDNITFEIVDRDE